MLSPERRTEAGLPWTSLNLTRLAWLTPVVAIGIAVRKPTQDNSYLWHVAAGSRQIELGHVLTADPFTFTGVGMPWRTQSWLLELGYGWLERFGPLASANVVVVLAAIVLLTSIGLRVFSGRGLLGPLAVLWILWLSVGYFTARPVFASLALFALLTLVTTRGALHWTIPLILWVWAAVHGGWIVGLGYLALQALRLRQKRLAVAVLAGAAMATVTAHGWAIWEILLRFAQAGENLDLIQEWLPPDLLSVPFVPYLVAILALVALSVTEKIQQDDLWVVLPFLAFSFTANRAVPLAGIALVSFIFPRNSSRLGSAPLARPFAIATILVVLFLPVVVPTGFKNFEETFPVEAERALRNVPTFHDDSTGGYLIYMEFPFVFVDDRAEFFGDLYSDFIEAREGKPAWEALFRRYAVSQVLLPVEATLVYVLEEQGWTRIYSDGRFVILADPAEMSR